MFNRDGITLYEALEVSPSASTDAIIKAFHASKNALKTKVSRVKGWSPKQTKEAYTFLKKAYKILVNTEKRKAYDAFLKKHRPDKVVEPDHGLDVSAWLLSPSEALNLGLTQTEAMHEAMQFINADNVQSFNDFIQSNELNLDFLNGCLAYAASIGALNAVKHLIEAYNLDPKTLFYIADTFQGDLLKLAVQSRFLPLVRYLVEECRMNVNGSSTSRWDLADTPLSVAIKMNENEMIHYLLDKNADIHFKLPSTDMLMLAIDAGNTEVVDLLILLGFKPQENHLLHAYGLPSESIQNKLYVAIESLHVDKPEPELSTPTPPAQLMSWDEVLRTKSVPQLFAYYNQPPIQCTPDQYTALRKGIREAITRRGLTDESFNQLIKSDPAFRRDALLYYCDSGTEENVNRVNACLSDRSLLSLKNKDDEGLIFTAIRKKTKSLVYNATVKTLVMMGYPLNEKGKTGASAHDYLRINAEYRQDKGVLDREQKKEQKKEHKKQNQPSPNPAPSRRK